MMELIVFVALAATLLTSAVFVLVAKNPLHGALALLVSLGSIALLFIQLAAPFLAAIQILIYAGAVAVLFVFVIMMLNLRDTGDKPVYFSFAKTMGVLALMYVMLVILHVAGVAQGVGSYPASLPDGSVRAMGHLFLTDYLLGFEAIALVLLVAVVGAVVLGQKRLT